MRSRSMATGRRTTSPGWTSGSPATTSAVGMDYMSCSPFRVPIARHAAAQAVVREKK